MRFRCRKNYRVKLLSLISTYGLLESDIFRKYAIKCEMCLEIWGSKERGHRDSFCAQLDLWHTVCFSLSWWDLKTQAGEQGTKRTISAPAQSCYPATYMMSPVASVHLKGSCASCSGQGHCCLVWIHLTCRAALWNCTTASCLAEFAVLTSVCLGLDGDIG